MSAKGLRRLLGLGYVADSSSGQAFDGKSCTLLEFLRRSGLVES